MKTFEEIRAAMDALEEAHGIKISVQYEAYLGPWSREEASQDIGVYIRRADSESTCWHEHYRCLPFGCDPIPFIQKAVKKWLSVREERKALEIERAKAEHIARYS